MVVSSDTITATIPAISATLLVKAATVTLDEQWTPYARATLVCAMPAQAVLDQINPATFTRVTIVLARTITSPSSRTLNLSVREVSTNFVTSEMTLQLASDESILQDLGVVGTRPNSTGQDQAWPPSTIVNSRLAALPAGWTLVDASGTTLQPFTFPLTNQVPNGGMESAFGLAGTNCTVTRTVNPTGGTHLQLSAPLTSDGYATIDGDLGALRNGMQPGKTYTIAALLRIDAILSGTASTRARRIVVFIQSADGTFTEVMTPVAANAVGLTRLAVSFTVPVGAIGATVRYYHGHTIGTLFWDDATLVEGDRDPFFFDGNTDSSGARYSYRWLGAAGSSASVRLAKLNATAFEALLQQPGQTHWNFLEPLISSLGLRLYCTESREFRMELLAAEAAGIITATTTTNLLQIGEQKSALNPDTFGAVVIRYRWIDSSGITREAFEAAGDPTRKVKLVERNHPPAGTQLAARLLRSAAARLRTYPVEVLADYSHTPTQKVTLTPPSGVVVNAILSAVTWTFPAAESELRLRNPITP